MRSVGRLVGRLISGLVGRLAGGSGGVRDGNRVTTLSDGVRLHLTLVAWRRNLDSDVNGSSSLSRALRGLGGGVDNWSDNRGLGGNRGLRGGCGVCDNRRSICRGIV